MKLGCVVQFLFVKKIVYYKIAKCEVFISNS